MTTDLWMLAAAAVLQWALILAASTPRMLKNGISWAMGNRQKPVEGLPQWATRAQKASDNLQENLILFAIVVLVVHVSGNANETSALGTQIFVGARLLHALIYIAGLAVIRTAAWMTSIAGMFIAASTLA